MKPLAFLPSQVQFKNQENAASGSLPPKNAACTLNSVAFTAEIELPEKLTLPTYGQTSPDLTLTCTANGKTLKKTIEPVNWTAEAYRNQAAGHMLIGFGLVGVAATGAAASNRDKSNDLWGYPQVVNLEY
ncbi:hypothetical protein TRL7639_02830 [Falsiruegeria litorea R37]|uniref:Uncharacterized protein n=1 Tax=Falsiruegeria litorea R37 TaxID=1200284 RepID=A0A1Y5T4Z3_9RHOB|nr:hypothetical protein [Falsiruegeria litorea]SLN54119.1 hypothetical protein TRL7639_02830 [Falsiruegeria litorea R37]